MERVRDLSPHVAPLRLVRGVALYFGAVKFQESIFALPFAYTHDRMGGVSVKVFAGIMLGVAFHLLNGLFSNLGVINAWPPVVAARLPPLCIDARLSVIGTSGRVEAAACQCAMVPTRTSRLAAT